MMQQIKSILVDWSRDEEGASLVEYVLLVALIAVVSIAAMTLMGGNIKSAFDKIAKAVGA
jgi:pilus assembly protein Flp/PilA